MTVEREVQGIRAELNAMQARDREQDAIGKDLGSKLDDMRNELHIIRKAVVGDPTDSSRPGLLMRIDRLEQTEKTRARVLWAVVTGIVGLIIERLRDVL